MMHNLFSLLRQMCKPLKGLRVEHDTPIHHFALGADEIPVLPLLIIALILLIIVLIMALAWLALNGQTTEVSRIWFV